MSVVDAIGNARCAVIEASAGTGKTYTLELMVASLVQSGVPLPKILVVTFTEKATAELKKRIRDKLAAARRAATTEVEARRFSQALGDFDQAAIATIHGFCQQVLEDSAFGARRFLTERLVDVDVAFEQAFYALLRTVRPEKREGLRRWIDGAGISVLHRQLRETLDPSLKIMPEGTPETLLLEGFRSALRAQLAHDKRARGEHDFDDMTLLVRDLLARDPAAVERLRARFQVALVDEFQDTDSVQWDIFRRIFFESADHRLFLIGDPKQAIYGFRGADLSTYFEARDAVGRSFALRESWRSTRPLLDAVNLLFDARIGRAPLFTGRNAYPEPVGCGKPRLALKRPDGRDAEAVALFPIAVAERRTGKGAVLGALSERIASEIAAILDGALRFDEGEGAGPEPIRPQDIFILGRTRGDLEVVADALRDARIPHAFFRRTGLYQTDEALHLSDLLQALVEPARRDASLRALFAPFFELDLPAAPEALDQTPEARQLAGWRELAGRVGAAELFDRVADESGLLRRLVADPEGERAHTNYLHLFDLLADEQREGGLTLEELARSLRRRVDAPRGEEETEDLLRLETEREAVQLMTMHVSKGLEAKVVFVVEGVNSRDPRKPWRYHADGARCLWVGESDDAEVAAAARAEWEEEEQRLLYVALTRARGRLYLPFYRRAEGGAHDPFGVTSGWRCVNDRIGALMQDGLAQSFLWKDSAPRAPAPNLCVATRVIPSPLPPPCAFDALRTRGAGYGIGSFSSAQSLLGAGTHREEIERDSETVRPSPDDFPCGANPGSYLHEALALVPPEAIARCASGEALLDDPAIQSLFDDLLDRFGLDRGAVTKAAALVRAAFDTPLFAGAEPLGKLSQATRLLREIEFHFPRPAKGHPLLGTEGRFSIGRELITGRIDLCFEAKGRLYWADWKSNFLAAYDPATLEDVFRANYRLQAEYYTLAMVRAADIRNRADYEARFGGFFYLFLRGMPNAGVRFERPGFDEVVAWQDKLLGGRS